MRKWMPLLAVCLGTFMLLVDVTIVTVALPDMAGDLRASFSSLQWVVDIYSLILAALMLGMGAIADRHGRRLVYLAGLVLFALASLASGLATSSGLLIAARGVQGIGGAAMYATTVALLSSSYQGRDRGVAFGVWGAVSGAAAASGPVLGGLLTQSLSWRWIFFVNLPVSVIAIIISARVLARGKPDASHRLDLPGVLTFTVGAAALTYGLIRATADGWTAPATLGLFALGLAGFAAFVLAERRSQVPLLDLSLLRRPAFTGVLAAGFALSAAAFAYLPYTSLWLQTVLGQSPVRAGLDGSAPMSLSSFVVSILAGRFLHRFSPRWVVGTGLALIGAGALLQATLSATSGGLALLPGLIVTGVGVGVGTPSLVSNAMSAVPHRSAGMAAGAVNTARQLGLTVGVAVLGGMFAGRLGQALRGTSLAASGPAISGGQAGAVLAQAPAARRPLADSLIHAAAATGLNDALLIAGLIGLGGAVIAVLTIRRPAPADAPVHAPVQAPVHAPADAPVQTASDAAIGRPPAAPASVPADLAGADSAGAAEGGWACGSA